MRTCQYALLIIPKKLTECVGILKFCFEQLKIFEFNVILRGEMYCNIIKHQQIEKMLQKYMKHNGSLIKYNENRNKNRN